MCDTKEDKVIEMYKQLNLDEKLRIFELIAMNDTNIYLHSDKNEIGFSVESDNPKFKEFGFCPTLNGLQIQFNVDLAQAFVSCGKDIDKWGTWHTSLESFLKPAANKKTKKKSKTK